ncbi:MAG: long-chain fatty acid--CoA ligase [Candidatus Dormiibacterota bacterium]
MSTEVTTETEPTEAGEELGTAVTESPLTAAKAPDVQDIEVSHQSVPELFQDQVQKRGSNPALYFKVGGKWQPITWEQYSAAVKRIAGFLLSEDVKHGERAAILSYNRPEWHIADLAIEHLGGTVVGIYLTNSSEQCQYIIHHAEARVVFVENRDQLAKIQEVRNQLPTLQRVVLISGEVEPDDGPLVTTWEAALARGDEYDREHPDEFDNRWKAIKRDDLATFIYTSGTTGPPKAVMLDHGNVLWTAESIKHTIDLADPDEDVTLSYLPLAHIAERMAGHILHVHNGHRIYFCEGLPQLAANVAEAQPTFMFGVPRIWEKFQAAVEKRVAETAGIKGMLSRWALKQGQANVDTLVAGGSPSGGYNLADRLVLSKIREALGLGRIKSLSTGAAPITQKTVRFFWSLGLPLYEVYGQSEGSGPTSTNRPGYARLSTVGPAMPGCEIRIAEDGEILLKGGNVFRGYFKDPEATRETKDADGWLHSGDVGIIEADGFLRITDRKKDLIITAGGKNISPSNIEAALKHQPFIGSAIAIGDSRPFMSALLTIDPELVGTLAKEVGAEADSATLSHNEKVREIFQAGVDSVNRSLSNVERIKKFTILPQDLSLEGGELTPTMKVKRKVVNEKYAGEIEGIYK